MEQTRTNPLSVTPKDFFLWAGVMIAFYTSTIALINLIFDYINYVYPDTLNAYWVDPYQSGISSEMATVIVALPVFVVLMRLIRGMIAEDSTRQEIWVRRWALMLTLFVSAAAILVTFVVLLTTFLNGEEMTARFLLKVLTMILVAGSAFGFFFADMKGYWKEFPVRARNIGYGLVGAVALIIIAGFFIVGTPRDARLARYDSQKVNDLQNIQWQIVNHWQQKEKIPATLAELSDPISNYVLPLDPQTKESYEYKVKGVHTFELCATFNAESRKMMNGNRGEVMPLGAGVAYDMKMGMSTDSWQHAQGHACFERTIDPERYPVFKKN